MGEAALLPREIGVPPKLNPLGSIGGNVSTLDPTLWVTALTC